MKPTTERRSFYRINDTIELTYSVCDGRDESPSHTRQDLDMPVTSLLEEIDREFNQASNTLWHENPTFAVALGLLNRKLSIIAAHSLCSDTGKDAEPYEELMVNISGSGIGFDTAESFAEGTRLFLSLVLKPSNVTLQLQGVVVGCESRSNSPGKSHWVRVNFTAGNEVAQEQLIQHIVQRQSALIQQKSLAR